MDDLISRKELSSRPGWSDTTIHRRMQDDPQFPKPRYNGAQQFFKKSEIAAWMEARPAPAPKGRKTSKGRAVL
jgi:predicted DNA-binding transcriptional regulator AlpA